MDSSSSSSKLLLLAALLVVLVVCGVVSQRPHPCEQSSCYPATGNLLIGREGRLSATSTCGLRKREKYCIVSHLEDKKKCFWCDSSKPPGQNDPFSHHVDNIVYRYAPSSRRRSWWQSENGVEKVSVQLDLEAEFHFTHLIMTFKTFRPAALLIERSYDFGRTWQVYRYFAYDCAESFPGVSREPPRNLTEAVCESRYSNVAPSTEGEVIFRVLPPNLPIVDPYSQEVQNLLKITNLRVNFTKLHTLGDDRLDYRTEIKEKYYYAVYDMVVRGSCSCYGHASRCLPLSSSESRGDMVHGRCECTHNTKGLNCEQCEDFYHDYPWKPAFGRQTNACKRCNCNGHTDRCHFDAAVYEATGQISGGVCDDCQHNTIGRNCEQCKLFYYQDPTKEMTDPDVCLPCDCDPRGSLDDGICVSRHDPAEGLQAGQCHCKTHVMGRRCDQCKHGYWNFRSSNEDGCQECTCNLLGTYQNQGCNVDTGECMCKRYVTGRDCDQCLPEHWGLSEARDGCKPCDCDPGGSYDNNCDVNTGECKCRPHVTGRTCNQPEQGFFAGLLDYRVYEAEFGKVSERGQTVVREPYADREPSWSGPGFVRVVEDSTIEFVVDGIAQSMEYDIVIRYEPQLSGQWEDVRVVLERPEDQPIDIDGPCANVQAGPEESQVSLPSGARHVVVYPPACLEAGVRYKLKLQFKAYDTRQETTSASVLIDSVAVVPRADGIPFLPPGDLRRQEFDHYRCAQYFYSAVKSDIPDVCRKHLYSIGFYVLGSGFECQCDPTGSYSGICDSLGGQCQCKPHVVGRRCDQCAPGTYGFGPEGCTPCECNSVGSLDNFCDAGSGQCLCRPASNTYGRACDQCHPGYWNFPSCQRCECNGHADLCDPRTGKCLECRDSTTDFHCDRCLDGFYGDPRLGVDIPCRPCPCPDTAASGHSYADRCALDVQSQDVVCECQEGYAGPRCDVCADNYFGDPDVPGGRCRPCQCNNNIDLSRPGNCDARTGHCLQCLFNTEGFGCEECQAGFFGDALNQLCTPCVCDLLGTDNTRGACNNVDGQCPCHPNVIGLSCDQCQPDHWKIASGTGCEPCECDAIGSLSTQCNEFDGQCECRDGFGGRRCDQCRDNYWGNPAENSCQPCNCDPAGSQTLQCDHQTGRCVCQPGIGGERCDRCDRGYVGTAPYCEPCGECFDNWDAILRDLQLQTQQVVQAASQIRETGATGAYTREFDDMQLKIEQVTTLLANTTNSGLELTQWSDLFAKMKTDLGAAGVQLDSLDSLLDNMTQRIFVAELALTDMRQRAADVDGLANALEHNSTVLQEANVEGALNLTREARTRAQKAQDRVEFTQQPVSDSERQRRRTEALLSRMALQLSEGQQKNAADLTDLGARLHDMEGNLPELNHLVCDGQGEPCDALCGGGGCGKCGALSCAEGAVTKSENALNMAREAETILRTRHDQAAEMMRGVRQAELDADAAVRAATESLEAAQLAQNRSETAKQQVDELIVQIDEFLELPSGSPADIRSLAYNVMTKQISLRPEQITDLARRINDTISSLTNIDAILTETSGDLTEAKAVKDRADAAKIQAQGILTVAQQVLDSLAAAQAAQDRAQLAIDTAEKDIGAAELHLTQIASETADAQVQASESVDEVGTLRDRLKELQRRLIKNERDVKDAAREAETAAAQAQRAAQNADELETAYERALRALDDKAARGGDARERALKLQEKANRLASGVADKLRELKDMEEEYERNEVVLKDLSMEVMQLNTRMNDYLQVISDRSDFYRTCQK